MMIENHILDILQLYEYAMAIGRSLDHKENCDSFLKLVLKRKSLNASWIMKTKKNKLCSVYALPKGKDLNLEMNDDITEFLNNFSQTSLIEASEFQKDLAPIAIDQGQIAVFNLNDQGYLFLYTQKHNLSEKFLSQLEPVIDKFYFSLIACKAFEEQKTLLQNLKVQNQELSDYAHMVSHDLKSPLRSIDTLTYWLKEDYHDKIDKEGQQQMDTIRTNVQKMEGLINGILEYSTLSKSDIEFYPVNLNVLLRDLLKMLNIPANVTVEFSDLPTLQGDKYRLQQLFQNLISNAIIHCDKYDPKIYIGVTKKGNYFQFYVSDNGPGIDHAYHDKIFNTFQKLTNDSISTGIGLSIVKKIVDIYDGKIWLESEIGKGTTFYFTLKHFN